MRVLINLRKKPVSYVDEGGGAHFGIWSLFITCASFRARVLETRASYNVTTVHRDKNRDKEEHQDSRPLVWGL